MRGIVGTSYGTPDRLHLEEIDRPTPGEKDVLIRVRAASINALDWHMATGQPMIVRLMAGLSKPKRQVRGVDAAGVVEEVGSAVTRFKPGDEVFGLGGGSFAEYVSCDENELQFKPTDLSFEDAAAMPIAGVTALQALQNCPLRAGQKVLVIGAGGGVGAFVVQLAKVAGGLVTGVCSARNAEFVRSLGADGIIDYTREDFVETDSAYDVVIDVVGERSLRDLRRVLTPRGTLVMVGGGKNSSRFLGPLPKMASAKAINRFIGQQIVVMLAKLTPESLEELATFYGPGKLAVPVVRTASLLETPDALNRLYTGLGQGKTVIRISG